MGATTFFDTAYGVTIEEAFQAAVETAQYENGNGGYSGTMAEKGNCVHIPLPKEWVGRPMDYADHLIDSSDRRIDDKWGPAGCILLEEEPMTEQEAYATTAKRYKQQGTRKWKTVFTLSSPQDEDFRAEYESQTEAEHQAKAYAKRYNRVVDITIGKKLINGNAHIVSILPKTKEVQSKKTMKKYLFFGWASC